MPLGETPKTEVSAAPVRFKDADIIEGRLRSPGFLGPACLLEFPSVYVTKKPSARNMNIVLEVHS